MVAFKRFMQRASSELYTCCERSKYRKASTFNNGYANIGTSEFSVQENDRRTLLKLYDQTKGFGDAFGQLVSNYNPHQKFHDFHITLLI